MEPEGGGFSMEIAGKVGGGGVQVFRAERLGVGGGLLNEIGEESVIRKRAKKDR